MNIRNALLVAVALSALAATTAASAQGARTAPSAHPDLTGVWSGPFRIHGSGLPLMTGFTPWLAPSQGNPRTYPVPTLDELSAIADKSVAEHHGVPIFGRPPPPQPPLTEAGMKATRAIDPKVEQQHELNCYPGNVLDRGGVFQIVQNAKAIAIMYEGGTPGRMIWMDGRSGDNAIPQWNGFSTGHWEGKTLKVHTVAIRGEGFGFMPRMVMDENMVLDEEYTLQPDGKSLDIFTTITDPTLYKEPLKRLSHVARAPDVLVTDYTCTEGKDDMVETIMKPRAIEGGPDGPPPGGPGGPPPGMPGGPGPDGPHADAPPPPSHQ